MKVFISPRFNENKPDPGDGGIRQVVKGQLAHLPQLGVEIVSDPKQADVANIHAGAYSKNTGLPTVASCHGLYWTGDGQEWEQWAWDVNGRVIEAMRQADMVTAPSKWVGYALQRGMLLKPHIVYHGIDVNEWTPAKEPKAYVLWNKTRADPVTDPADLQILARLAPEQTFLTTFGAEADNLKVIGRQPFHLMQQIIQNTNIYLATARETFGIGTLEAMAAAVPVLGWDWGGQREIITHKVTGYLAEVGNHADLLDGLHYCLKHRERLGANARVHVAEHFTWAKAAEAYLKAYETALGYHQGPKVSVIVPAFKQTDYLPLCIQSIKDQTLKDWEMIIVNDCSPDNTGTVADQLAAEDSRVKVIHNERNVYLAEARNIGMRAAEGQYLVPLDSDDQLATTALELLSKVLDDDPSLHIVYGSMRNVEPDGSSSISGWPPRNFDFVKQVVKRQNQVPVCSMYRRKVFENTGGYRRRMRSAEDAEFWTRAVSFGFTPAKVTDAVTFIKSEHPDSMGRAEAVPEWNAWATWRTDPALVPFGAIGKPLENKPAWLVPSYSPPQIAVVIPVKPGHDIYLQDALDSLIAQTFINWEVIVVNDGAEPFTDAEGVIINPYLAGFPFVQIIEGILGEPQGPAWARNRGIEAAEAPLFVLLDADDFLQPQFLETALKAYYQADGGFIYTDWWAVRADNSFKLEEAQDWDCMAMTQKALCTVTSLYAKADWQTVWDKYPDQGGGIDETIHGWEDWEYYLSLMELGLCGTRIALPLWTYRFKDGGRRDESYNLQDSLLQYISNKHPGLYKGDRKTLMACKGCPKGGGRARTLGIRSVTAQELEKQDLVLIEYIGPRKQKITYRSPITKTNYAFDLGPNRRKFVRREDVEWLLARPGFQKVQQEATPQAELDVMKRLETDETVVHKLAQEPTAPPPQTPIDTLGLKSGTINALKAGSIDSVEELFDRQSDLINIRGIGPQRLEEINHVLAEHLQKFNVA